ncbi:hypothetical protein LguiA_034644 [Lonicera macranthoides]
MILLECLTWVPNILGELGELLLVGPFISRRKRPFRPHIPDDVIIDILSRLPADCVVKCQRVCRKWRALTSSPSFAELHLERGATTTPPSIFLHRVDCPKSHKRGELNFRIYDDDDEPGGLKKANNIGRRKRIITKVRIQRYGHIMFQYRATVLNSCDGLIMFLATVAEQYHHQAFVLNPITQELITIHAPFQICAPCGIYRDPSTCEYKLLLSSSSSVHDAVIQYYYTCSLKSMVFEKLKYSSTCKNRLRFPPAILLNGSLHWMVDHGRIIEDDCTYAIMVFGAQNEDFRVLPHPGDKSVCRNRPAEHFNMQLLGTREHLWLCHVFWGEIHVWVLEDYACWAWDRRYKVNLKWSLWRFPFHLESRYDPITVRILGIHNGVELLISWYMRGMFLYNLEQNTVRKFAIFKVDESYYFPLICMSAYTKSLVRLDPPVVSKKKKRLQRSKKKALSN